MKQILLLIALIISQSAYGALDVVGNKIIDSATNSPISNAKITIPKYNYSTYTDTNGNFNFEKNIDSSTIMSVEKEGYRPFSLTINQRNNVSKPLVLGIEKSNISDIVIESSMMHLGDDNYSQSSANADNFRLNTIGPSFSKNFIMKRGTLSSQNYLVIGSILGIDTLLARSMGQNSIVNSYASPPEVYFNGVKIAEIQLNGDNQKIKLPNNLIKAEQANQITIKAGKNLMQRAYLDYDDIEIANLSIMSE